MKKVRIGFLILAVIFLGVLCYQNSSEIDMKIISYNIRMPFFMMISMVFFIGGLSGTLTSYLFIQKNKKKIKDGEEQ